MLFPVLTVVTSIVAVLCLIYPLLLKKERENNIDRSNINIKSAAIKLNELKQELESGLISTEEFQQYQLELEKNAAIDLQNQSALSTPHKHYNNKILAIIIALIVPIFSIAVYQHIGDGSALEKLTRTNESTLTNKQVEELLVLVEKKIRDNPKEVEARIALGKVYVELERFNDAANIYRELNELIPTDPDFLVNYAETLARSQRNQLTGKPALLLDEALALQPNHGRALWLAGFADKQDGNTEAAIAHWQQLLANIEPENEFYSEIEKLISDTKNGLTAPTEITNKSTTISIQVNVSLAPQLQSNIKPDTSLFIFARAAEGPSMPLAVHRGIASDLPITVTLDDSMAMIPHMKLSSFDNILIGARLSSNDQPQGQSGDLEGFSAIINTSTISIVNVAIDSIKQ